MKILKKLRKVNCNEDPIIVILITIGYTITYTCKEEKYLSVKYSYPFVGLNLLIQIKRVKLIGEVREV